MIVAMHVLIPRACSREMTVKEFAAFRGISEATVWRMLREKKLEVDQRDGKKAVRIIVRQ